MQNESSVHHGEVPRHIAAELSNMYRHRGTNLNSALRDELAAHEDTKAQLASMTLDRDTYRELLQQSLAACHHTLQERDALRKTRDEQNTLIRELRAQVQHVLRSAA